MGKTTGFLEFKRQSETYLPVDQRLQNYGEFTTALSDDAVKVQGARCMDCGIPFCNNGCPVNNIIPDWNDLVYQGQWQTALDVLHATNNFPEFTGRVCPAPCEAACTLGINDDPVGIKSIERYIADKGWEMGWIRPLPAAKKTGKTVAIVGSGPAGLAAAQQLARVGHTVTVFEKNSKPGGLLRLGIPNFKLDKKIVERRINQLVAEGVTFRTNCLVAVEDVPAGIANSAQTTISAETLMAGFDAVILAGGSEVPRDLPIPGRELKGIYNAMTYLVAQTEALATGQVSPINVNGKRVVVIGGGDTGSDCVGTANRQGAASVMQFEVMPQPPISENKPLTWPYWPLKLRTSSSHEEGCERQFAINTKSFIGTEGQLTALQTVKLQWEQGKMQEIPGQDEVIPADYVFLAMGFVHPLASVLERFDVTRDNRGNAQAQTEGGSAYKTNVNKVFVAGDIRRGQSLVVWAIREGRQCAHSVDTFLMGSSTLPV